PRLKTHWIRYFLVCRRFGSVSEAARFLSISPQALNRNLNALEQMLDQSLFLRQRGQLILTEAGIRFGTQACLLLEEIDSLYASFRSPGLDPVPLRIGWSRGWDHQMLSNLLGHTLDSLSRVFPSIRQLASQQQLEAALLQQELDLALACRQPRDPRLAYARGTPVPYVIVSAPQPRRHWQNFHYSLLIEPESRQLEPLDWNEVDFPRRRSFETDSLEACIEMCRQGVTAACLPLALVEPWLMTRELAIVADLPEPLFLTPVIFWRRDQLPEMAHVVIQAMLRELNG
ncbi:MAG: hypothetical protein CVV27_09540, partial [Candidatus Melainabacteria bacterium HGW-Melainabacteria-1]